MKKAALNISLMEIIGLIIGSLVIITLIFFVMGITDLFKNNPEQATYDNYDVLISSVNDLVKGQAGDSLNEFPDKKIEIVPAQENAVQVTIPLYIQEGFGIVGFDREEIRIKNCAGVQVKSPLKKPEMCSKIPCLCLYKQGPEVGPYAYSLCTALRNIGKVSVVSQSEYNYGGLRDDAPGNDLYVRAKCGQTGQLFNVKNVKIIKLPRKEEGKFDLIFDILPS
ncbi:MAG: hypothetical protein AABW88_02430 [Nanoarchaeota archaeon]